MIDTNPYWYQDDTEVPPFPTLDTDLEVDVVVVGGGVTGITTACLLKDAGQRVALLERHRCIAADSGHTTAHLTAMTDTRLSRLIETFGRDHAGAVWDAGLAGIDQIDTFIRTRRIDCHFAWVSGYLHLPFGDTSSSDVRDRQIVELREEAAEAAALGFDVAFVDSVEPMGQPGLRFEGQARIHPRRYLSSLVRSIPGDGSFVFEHSNADDVTDRPVTVLSGQHRIRCRNVIIATHVPIAGNAGVLASTLRQTKLAAYSTYVVGGRVPHGRMPDALFWDTNDPYMYVRLDRPRREASMDTDYVMIGGEDHKTGQASDTEACFRRIEQCARRLVPELVVSDRWSGQVIETYDGLPLIGPVSDSQFIATGFAGNGYTFGTVAAMMAHDWVRGRRNPWQGLFDAGRTTVQGGAWDYIKENKDYPYYLIRDRFAGAAGRSLRQLGPGEGRILELGGRRVAAYRNGDGALSVKSAVCTHMGCYVEWNQAEGTWDCPCHGSRFGATGDVLAGPAETPLKDNVRS